MQMHHGVCLPPWMQPPAAGEEGTGLSVLAGDRPLLTGPTNEQARVNTGTSVYQSKQTPCTKLLRIYSLFVRNCASVHPRLDLTAVWQ